MKLCIIGDTHYGFSPKHNKLISEMLFKIKDESPNYIVHCGDIQSSQFSEAKTFWETTRSILGKDVRISSVLGNHDYWQAPSPRIAERNHALLMFENGIHDFDQGPVILRDTLLVGVNGWYHNDRVLTNDSEMIGEYYPAGKEYLRNKADSDFEVALRFVANPANKRFKNKILVTHFEFINGTGLPIGSNYMGENPRWQDFIDDFTHIISGHRHLPSVGFPCGREGKQLYYNCGAHYNDPQYIILDI